MTEGFLVGFYTTVIICLIGIMQRNAAVHSWYKRMNNKIADMGRREIYVGIEPRWDRWKELDVDKYDEMMLMFWKSPASFYRGKGYDWMEGE